MPKVKSRGLDHSAKGFFMWFFMWFCKILWQNLVMFKYKGWFYLFATLLDYTKAVWNLKAQEIGILNDCTFCGKLFKTTGLQNHKGNHTKCQFWTERSNPLHWTHCPPQTILGKQGALQKNFQKFSVGGRTSLFKIGILYGFFYDFAILQFWTICHKKCNR